MKFLLIYVPNLRFNGYTENWQKYRTIELGKMQRGKSKHRPRDDEKLYGGNYPFIQTGDIKKANLYIREYERTYSNYGLSQSKLWSKGTLCITIAANIAETAILGLNACFPDSVIGWISNEKITNNIFIKYYFDFYKTQLKRLSVGGAQENLNLDKLENVYFNIPTLSEQNDIANLLTKIDELIDTQSKIIDRLQSQINYIKGQILNLTTTIETKSLDQLCDISTGKRDANEMKVNGMYKFFTCSREDYCIDTYSFEGEALIISGNGELGLIKYYNGKFDAYQRTYVLQNFSCHPKYLMYVLQSKLPKKIEKEKNVGAMPYIVLKTLTSINVEIPNMHNQIEIVNILNKFEERLENEQILLELFKKEKSFLLKNLFV